MNGIWKHGRNVLLALSMTIMGAVNLPAASMAGMWQDVGVSLSGLARMDPPRSGKANSFVGVVDSKGSSGTRVVIVDLDSDYQASVTTLAWPNNDPPDDLESVAAIPNGKTGVSQQFVAANSGGDFWRFTINGTTIQNLIEGDDSLNREGANSSAKQIESIAFYNVGGGTKIVWSGRGSRDHSARFFMADLENKADSIDYDDDDDWKNQETNYPWPRPKWSDDDQTRLVSDLKVDPGTGTVYASACFDGGNNGPFAGVLYAIGRLTSSKINFSNAMFSPLTAQFVAGSGKKVEALEFLGAGASSGYILGTDDENLGGFVLVMPPKP